ncbi:MAG: alpha amylase C-terminal domain-containing protein [Caldilineaceae bacterium]|nr:alpha amylase C-terminal domain-containing protein [Caldilineaceae bacterium]
MLSRFTGLFNRAISQDRLPQDLRGGVYLDLVRRGTATFVFRAPHKTFVSVVGDFNGWDTRAHPMETDGEGTWWLTVPYPGDTRYGFYVMVDDDTHVWVGDPYATEVNWDSGTPWGVLNGQYAAFRWTDARWRTPPLRDLVIYELCVRDAAGGWLNDRPQYGNFERLMRRLPHLQELGVNAVELMPIQAFPGDSSWGYNPVFYHAPASVYGTPQDFKRFVNACHRAGIAVILDVAFNHAWGEHPYYRIYPPMYGPKGEWWTRWNPFFHHTPASINMWGGVDWDHFNPETTRYFQDVVRYWLEEYHVDGFRFDWVGGVDYDSNDPLRPGFDPYHGISAICWAARQAKPDCILVGEFWQLDGTNHEKSAARLVHDTEMDAVWNGYFHHTLDEIINHRWQWEKRDIFRAIGGFRDQGFSTATQTINYTCSHDEVRPEHEIKFYTGKHIPRPGGMSIQQLALVRARLGLVALFAAPGVPMLYAGQEYGDDSPRTIDFVPMQWDKLRRAAHRTHYEIVRRLVRARKQHPALRSEYINFLSNDFASEHLVRFCRWDDNGDYAVIAINFASHSQDVRLPVPHDGRWRDVVRNRLRTAANGWLSLRLHAYDAALFVAVRRTK